MNPALIAQLRLYGINPRESRLSLCPFCQALRIACPVDLDTDRVVVHAIKVGIVGGRGVEKVAPKQLPMQRRRWVAALHFLVKVTKLVVEEARR